MYNFGITCVSVAFFICSVAAEFNLEKFMDKMPEEMKKVRDECLTDVTVTIEDLAKFQPGQEPTKEQLCFFKCFKTKTGMINGDGTIDMDNVKDNPFVKKLTEEEQSKFVNCIEKAGKIVECEDVKKLRDCAKVFKMHRFVAV